MQVHLTLTIRVLSPICNGKDKKGFDAIIVSQGMHRLRLGIGKALCEKTHRSLVVNCMSALTF